MTQLIQTVSEWKMLRNSFQEGSTGFVPTMGNLHKGHESLLARCRAENRISVLSLFVNPTQFDDPKDFENYRRTLDSDLKIASDLGIDWVFAPTPADLYPDKYHYRMRETCFSHILCGQHRPGHFEGMLTIVLKLLLLIKPASAYFGEKDFQQLKLVQGMVRTFFMDVNIVPCQTIRDANGLALSSRNLRLSAEEYQLAIEFPKLLHSTLNCQEISNQLSQRGFIVEYIEEQENRRFGAVKLGDVRLIDNVLIKNFVFPLDNLDEDPHIIDH